MSGQAYLYAAASIASVATAALHAFAGGAMMARPFYRKAGLHGLSTHAFRYCWHFVTVALVLMGAGYAYLATAPQLWPLGAYLSVSAASYSALSVAVSLAENSPPLKSPPTTLAAIVATFGFAALGVAGLWAD